MDVVTVGIWKKADERRKESLRFMKRVENKEFEILMLSSTLNLVEKWKNLELSTSIKDFYYRNTSHFVEDSEIFNFLTSNKVSSSSIIDEFLKKGIKEEDIMLILTCIAVNADYLVTFNRRHLKNNVDLINLILMKNKLNKIKVVYPNEI